MPDPRAEPDGPDDAPDTLPAPPPVHPRHALPPPAPSTGPRTRPSSPRALRIADILAEGRRAAGLPEDPTADPNQEPTQ